MSSRMNLFLQGINLLSQSLASMKGQPDAEIFHKTSLVHPKYAKAIGVIKAMETLSVFPSEMRKDLDELADFFEILGIATFPRTELTHLGGRVAHRNVRRTNIGERKGSDETEMQSVNEVPQEDEIPDADKIE